MRKEVPYRDELLVLPGELGDVLLDRRLEVETSLFLELHRRCRGPDHLAQRGHVPHGVLVGDGRCGPVEVPDTHAGVDLLAAPHHRVRAGVGAVGEPSKEDGAYGIADRRARRSGGKRRARSRRRAGSQEEKRAWERRAPARGTECRGGEVGA